MENPWMVKTYISSDIEKKFNSLTKFTYSFELNAGFGFKIDEIVQAWNDMYDAKRWESEVSTFRLEPLFHRRIPKLHSVIEHVSLYCS